MMNIYLILIFQIKQIYLIFLFLIIFILKYNLIILKMNHFNLSKF